VNWNDIRYLEALVRLETVAHVAREMGIAPSTVYRRIARLERDLGAPCMVRGSMPIVLTPAGQALVAAAQTARTGFSQAQATARLDQETCAGQVSLTTVADFLPFIVEPIATVRQAHPQLEIAVHLADAGPSVRRREVDLAVAVIAHPPEGLVGRRLAPIHYGVFGRADVVEQPAPRWIVSGPPRVHTPNAIWERQHAGVTAIATGARLASIEFLKAGLGVGVLPRRIARLHPELVEVIAHREALMGQTRDVWLLYHPDVRQTARVRVLTDALFDALTGPRFAVA
jgi:DNA-binding transcriptional LysR family regulator